MDITPELIIQVLGFTSLGSIVWNIAAYVAFLGIIVAVFWEKGRNQLFAIAGIILAAYAFFFLHDNLLATLQTLVGISAFLQWFGVSERQSTTTMILLTTAAAAYFVTNEGLSNIWVVIGAIGSLSLIAGIITLPRPAGFLVMIFAGALRITYTFVVGAWVFFLLNIFFIFANALEWFKAQKPVTNIGDTTAT